MKTESAKADVMVVEFDRSLHFPRVIEIDYNVKMVDDGIFYQLSDVQATQ